MAGPRPLPAPACSVPLALALMASGAICAVAAMAVVLKRILPDF